jgi:transcriptional regulator with XRE-family HTH domain
MTTKAKSKAIQFLEKLNRGPLTLRQVLIATREGEEWSQAEMARRLGVSAQHLSQVEKGLKTVSPERAAAWGTTLGYGPEVWAMLAAQEQLDRAGLNLTVIIGDGVAVKRSRRARAAAPKRQTRKRA